MTKDEALKLALDALEGADQIDCDMQAAITAIKEALAQPAQEPVAWEVFYPDMGKGPFTTPPLLVQPEERNFCPRCGKRTADLTTIHTCTPPT
jgi:hypothetical protein